MLTKDELQARRNLPGGCYCDDLRKDGTCKSCGCLNIRISLPNYTATDLIKELSHYHTTLEKKR